MEAKNDFWQLKDQKTKMDDNSLNQDILFFAKSVEIVGHAALVIPLICELVFPRSYFSGIQPRLDGHRIPNYSKL